MKSVVVIGAGVVVATKHKWKLEIGDRSGDGHSQCDTFLIESNLTVEEANEAYFAAKKALKKGYPETICHDYEDGSIDRDMIDKLHSLGFEFTNWDADGEPGDEDEIMYPGSDGMAQLTLWFIKQGNPEFKYKILSDNVPTFGGHTKKGYIGQIGYGVFSC